MIGVLFNRERAKECIEGIYNGEPVIVDGLEELPTLVGSGLFVMMMTYMLDKAQGYTSAGQKLPCEHREALAQQARRDAHAAIQWCAERADLGDAIRLKHRYILFRNHSPNYHGNIRHSLLFELLNKFLCNRQMCTRENTQPDYIHFFLEGCFHDLLNSAVQARIDNLHSRILQGFADNFSSNVMPIQTRLPNKHSYWPLFIHSTTPLARLSLALRIR